MLKEEMDHECTYLVFTNSHYMFYLLGTQSLSICSILKSKVLKIFLYIYF